MYLLSRVTLRIVLLGSLLLTTTAMVSAQQTGQQPPTPSDNTKVNERDRSDNQLTADQQKDNPSDRQLTQQIRRPIVQDNSLSTYAHNIKVISQNGKVTLKGPVPSEDEKRTLEAKANEIAGKDNVVSELSVVPTSK